ncbi:MAG: site-specific integrase [Gammaproteobacteria bacterium]|nr:site-specific integrase [Gammaproteobacteria bacterium]
MREFNEFDRPDISLFEVRKSLPCKRQPYWMFLAHCRHVGYSKRESRPARWMARYRTKDKKYRERQLGSADDPAFTYAKAVLAAREWFAKPENRAIAANEYPVGPCENLRVCPIGDIYTIGHALHEYVEWKRISGTRNAFLICLSLINYHIIPTLSHIPLSEFTGAHYRVFAKRVLETPPKRGGRPIGPRRSISQLNSDELRRRKASLNTLVSILRCAVELAWENGHTDNERAWRCLRRVPNVERPRLRFLLRDECRALLAHCREDVHHLILGALYTGCRSLELIRLRVEDVARDGYGVYVGPSKNYKARFVYLPDEGMAYLLQYCRGRRGSEPLFPRKDGKHWPYRHYRHVFRAALDRAGLAKDFTFHGLRHTYASQLVQSGMPLSEVAAQLGHADASTVIKTYGHLAPQIREAEIRYRFSPLDVANVRLAEEQAPKLEKLRRSLHGPDWRSYAVLPDEGSWPRSNFFRGDPELVALCRSAESPPRKKLARGQEPDSSTTA